MGMSLQIPEERIAQCRRWADQVAEKVKGRANFDGQTGNARYRYLCGYLGEEAFAAWARAHELPYQHRVRTDGRRGPTEFTIGRYTVEVKALGRPERDTLIIGAGRDLTASLFAVARSANTNIELGTWEMVRWFPRAMLVGLPMTSTRFGSEVREIALEEGREMGALVDVLRAHLAGPRA